MTTVKGGALYASRLARVRQSMKSQSIDAALLRLRLKTLSD